MLSEFTDASFHDYPLDPRVLRAIDDVGYASATPIQAATLAPLLSGKDLIARARTGSGKTAAFLVPLLQRIREGGVPARALIFAPTRELARQISRTATELAAHLPVEVATIYGGIPYPPQLEALQTASLVVGTPGRIRDHVARGTLDLSSMCTIVLDEADRMFQMGLVEDIVHILDRCPEGRQVVMFSATMPAEIQRVAQRYQNDPVTVHIESEPLSVAHIQQMWTLVPRQHTLEALELVLNAFDRTTALVFSQTRVGAAEVGKALIERGFRAAALHGDMSQRVREQVLQRVRDREVDVLVATDVAARGLDVDHITHVINLEMPTTTETYVHRIGRTGRLGREGVALTFATSKAKRDLHALGAEVNHEITPVDLPVAEGTPRPSWSRSAAVFGRPPPKQGENVNQIRLLFSVGRHHKIRAADLVGFLTKEAGVSGRDVGRVELLDRLSFVGVSRETGADVLARFPEATIQGLEVRLSEAAPAPHEPEPPPRRKGRGRGRRRR